MSVKILVAVILGIVSGYFVLPPSFFSHTDVLLDVGLCLLLFFVGIDIGKNKEVMKEMKQIGFQVLIVPGMIALGSIVGGMVGGSFFGMPYNEGGAIGAGFGWYSLSAILLAGHSSQLSALAFISNVVREVLAILCIPFIAKYIGDLEAIAPAGATAMDTTLPIISRNTNAKAVIISFITGIILSLLVPVIVPIIIQL